MKVPIEIEPGVVFKDMQRPQRRFRLVVVKVDYKPGMALVRDNRNTHYELPLRELADPKLYRLVRAS